MATEFKLPKLAESVVEGEIVQWLVQEGEPIAVDQAIVEVMSDKATVELTSTVAGVVSKLGLNKEECTGNCMTGIAAGLGECCCSCEEKEVQE